MVQATLADHFERIHADDVMYVAPRACLSFQSLDEALSEPLAKRARVSTSEEEAAQQDLPNELDQDAAIDGFGVVAGEAGGGVLPSDMIYFQVTMKAPSNKKVV